MTTTGDLSNIELPGRFQNPEMPLEFIPTPERVSQYLELKQEEVEQQMKSVEGRKTLRDQLMAHEDDLRQDHENFDPMTLQTQLEDAGEALSANERYLNEIQEPEQKGMFRRAWESVKGFAKEHPVVTTLLAASVVAGGVAGAFYATGNWELLMAATGLNKILSGAEAAGELIPPTPLTPPLPGGGIYEVLPPITPPDLPGGPI